MHHVAWVVPPLVLAGVLTFSAVSKLGKGESLRSIVRNLRLSDRILPVPLARAIPGIELALAAGLLLPWAPAFGLAAAGCLGLMLVYWALIARGLTIHPRPSCGCFGQAGEHQISGRTLLRNTLLVLAAAGAVALALSGRTVWSLLGDAAAGDWWWLALGALACAATGLVLAGSSAEGTMMSPTSASTGHSAAHEGGHEHAHDHGHRHVDDAADPDGYVRTPIPRVVLHDPASGPVTLHELSAQRAQLLVLVDCYCESTRVAMGQVESWDARFELVDVRLVFSIPLVDSLGTPPAGTLVDHAGLAWEALGLPASPSAVLLGIDGHLAGGPASGYDEVLDFLDEVQEVLAEALPPQDRLMDEGRLSDEGQLTAER
ncbi:MauE/DoxX family redox-associated membrane protein [Knoellia sp. LjRoot47]|uniref:MauE/DoxX family redox-associated membrane protein n=1 Tax=Knoellia sp. LjRoot47 TaxID=3342330 RepID=UPI003ECEC915